jgi:hypothetical protein
MKTLEYWQERRAVVELDLVLAKANRHSSPLDIAALTAYIAWIEKKERQAGMKPKQAASLDKKEERLYVRSPRGGYF